MRKWAEVLKPTIIRDEGGFVIEACLDVTDEADGGNSVMADLKVLYPNCQYRWHRCQHDDNKGCVTEVAL